jgi:hypothetical protein
MTDAEKLAVMDLLNSLLIYRVVRDASVKAIGFDELERKREERERTLTVATEHLDKAVSRAQAICNA